MVSTIHTIVGVFEDYSEAASARQDLLRQGFREQDVQLSQSDGAAGATESGRETGFWAGVRDLFGMDDTEYYEEASRRGSVLVTVTAGPEEIDRAANILEQHHPIDIEERANQWRGGGWQPRGQEQPTGERQGKSVPIGEEHVSIGKRAEKRGGVRIYKRVHETPVEEDVRLREERVDVHRRPADRPADEDAFREETIEARNVREEPVVKKEARVKEEVVIDKDVQERDAKVRDKARRTDVEVERLDADDETQRHSQRPDRPAP